MLITALLHYCIIHYLLHKVHRHSSIQLDRRRMAPPPCTSGHLRAQCHNVNNVTITMSAALTYIVPSDGVVADYDGLFIVVALYTSRVRQFSVPAD